MIIPSEKLPSSGQYKDRQYIELKPMTYTQMKEYDKYPCKTTIEKYLRDIDCLISKIPSWEGLLLFDLDSIIFSIKCISVSESTKLKIPLNCKRCGEFMTEFDLNELDFVTFDESKLEIHSVKLANEVFMVNPLVTVGQFKDMLIEIGKYNIDIDRSELFALAMLSTDTNRSKVYNILNKATTSDIAMILYLSTVLTCSTKPLTFKCPNCNEEVVVGVQDLITDLFRYVRINADMVKLYNSIK